MVCSLLENLEQYLLHVNSGVEVAEMFEKIMEDCTLEYGGSLIHKYIHILVCFGNFGSYFKFILNS